MVRFAVKEELEQVNKIRKQVHEVHWRGRPDIFRADFCKELQDAVFSIWENEESDVIVVERNGVICGFACVEYVTKPLSAYNRERQYYRIAEFGVDESHRRQKVATELFAFIKEQAKRKGLSKIELDMWEFNETALKFYESVGFKTYRRYMEYDNE